MNLRHTLVGSVVPIVWALCLFLTGSGVAAAAPGLGGQSAPATLSLSPEALVFDTQVGRADASQFTDISVTSNDGSPVYVATVRTGSDWLTVGSVDSGNTISWGQSVVGQMPGTVRVFAKYGNLLPGIHFGTIAISPVEAPDSPVILPITVNVRARTTLLLRPNVLNFQYQAGYKANYPQPQSISLFGNKTSFSTLISSDSSLGWLSISPRTSVTPAILTVAVSPSGLPVGVYQATVAVVAPDAINSGVTFTVVLTVTDSATSTILPSSLSLRAPYGSHQPVFGSLSIYTNSTPFAISAAPAAGVPWLSVQTVDQWAGAADGKTGAVLPTPGIVRVWADPTGLAVGNYTSSVIIGDTATSTPVHVTLKINPNDLIIPQVADGGG
ncbi:MAG TPA: hypothetical protein VE398_14065, partial [Acidobacteriota bacterium]|nr:hypothetical protein [Acidobacteriota bacterium]